jgi:hypothetical protein
MNKEHAAASDPSDRFAFIQSNNLGLLDPPYGREEDNSYRMSQPLEGLQNLGLEDPLQADDAWNKGLASPSLINIDGSMAQETTVQCAPQEATIQNDPVNNPVMQIAQDDGFSLVQYYLDLEDPLQVDDATNKGLASRSLINIDGPMAQETTVQNAPQEATIQNDPVNNPEMPIALDDVFSQDQQNLGLEDPLQVDNAWNKGLASPSMININGPMPQETTVQNAPQEATIQNDPVDNPMMLIDQDDGLSLVQYYLDLEDPLQVDDAWNKGLSSPSLINIDGSLAQETTVQNAPQQATIQNDPVDNPVTVMPIAQDDGFSQNQEYHGLEDLLQVNNAQNKGLASPSGINIDGLMVQEGTIQNGPVDNPVMPIAQDDGLSLVQEYLGLEDMLQVDNAWNKGLASPSVINIDGPMTREGTIQNPPAHNPVKPTAQDDEFWSWSPLGDFDMLIG